nr:lipocalin family protein [Elizabethkingia bruuniana]
MKKTLSFLITGFSLFSFAQQIISPEAVTGIWKLKEAGFYENNKKVKKDFDACRLQRHYIIKADGTAIYNYYEGSVQNCYKSDPRETYWKITDGKLVFFIGNEIYQEEKITNFNTQKWFSTLFRWMPLMKKIRLLQRYCKQYTMKIWRK